MHHTGYVDNTSHVTWYEENRASSETKVAQIIFVCSVDLEVN